MGRQDFENAGIALGAYFVTVYAGCGLSGEGRQSQFLLETVSVAGGPLTLNHGPHTFRTLTSTESPSSDPLP